MLVKLLFLLWLSGLVIFAQQPNAALVQRSSEEGEQALAERRYEDAEKAYEKLRQLMPGTAEVHARLGLIFYQQGKFEQAVPVLPQALKLKPTLPNLDILLAMSLSALGQYQGAGWFGRTLVSLRKPDQALPPLRKAIALNANNEVTWFQLAQAYRVLSNSVEQQKAFAEYQRLRNQKLQSSGGANFSRPEETKQKADAGPPP